MNDVSPLWMPKSVEQVESNYEYVSQWYQLVYDLLKLLILPLAECRSGERPQLAFHSKFLEFLTGIRRLAAHGSR